LKTALADTALRQQPPNRLACPGAQRPLPEEFPQTWNRNEAGTMAMSTTVTIRPDSIAIDCGRAGN